MTRPKNYKPPPPPADNIGPVRRYMLKSEPKTCAEIAEAIGLPKNKVLSAIARQRFLRPEEVFRIVEWRQQGTCFDLAVYAMEAGRDEPRPIRKIGKTHKPKIVRATPTDKPVVVVPLNIPEGAPHSKFVNDINPWTQQRMTP